MVLLKKVDQSERKNLGPSSGRVKKYKSSEKKPANERKRPLDTESVYGEELFASNIKTEKQIVVHFYPFTKNNLRISSDGKFIIEKIDPSVDENEYKWNLFYFEPPIDDFEPPKEEIEFKNVEYTIVGSKIIDSLTNIFDLEVIRTKVIALVREEFLVERLRKLQDLQLQEATEKKEKEAQELAQELAEEIVQEVKEELVYPKEIIIPELPQQPVFDYHRLSNNKLKTVCGKSKFAVKNITDDLDKVTCEKCK